MSKTFALLALTFLMFTPTTTTLADDSDLFSDIRTDSVFNSPSSGPLNFSGGSSGRRRITKAEELREMMKSVGFEAKVLNNRMVTTQKELAPWTFPVIVELSEDETSVTITLGLRSISDIAKELPAAKLLEMMQISQDNAPVLFAYHSQRERTEVSSTLRNRGLTGESLRDEVNRLAIVGKKHETTWSAKEKTQEAPQQETPPQKNSSPAVPASLVGRWSAARSATEAFAIEFTSRQTFSLVYVNNGQQTKSSGTYRLGNGSLSLIGSDGTQTKGSLTLDSDTQFTLTLPNTTALAFRKAR